MYAIRSYYDSKVPDLNAYRSEKEQQVIDVLQQFRLIYGSMRRHFRLVEERCGMSGSQMWVLQEVQRSPSIGIGELAERMGVHQSTCSQLVEKLVAQGCLDKRKMKDDQRRVGLQLTGRGLEALDALVITSYSIHYTKLYEGFLTMSASGMLAYLSSLPGR